MDRDEARKIRLALGLTQTQLAHRLGYSVGRTVSAWEIGVTPVPRLIGPLLVAMSQGYTVEVPAYEQRRKPLRRDDDDPLPLTAAE